MCLIFMFRSFLREPGFGRQRLVCIHQPSATEARSSNASSNKKYFNHWDICTLPIKVRQSLCQTLSVSFNRGSRRGGTSGLGLCTRKCALVRTLLPGGCDGFRSIKAQVTDGCETWRFPC